MRGDLPITFGIGTLMFAGAVAYVISDDDSPPDIPAITPVRPCVTDITELDAEDEVCDVWLSEDCRTLTLGPLWYREPETECRT